VESSVLRLRGRMVRKGPRPQLVVSSAHGLVSRSLTVERYCCSTAGKSGSSQSMIFGVVAESPLSWQAVLRKH
jgi:hypothetical protein